MKIHAMIPAMLLVVIFSCRENKSATSTPETGSGSVSPGQSGDSLMALIVSFYSIGSGPDRGQPEKLKLFVESYSKKINQDISYSEVRWGKEGEVDYCFPLFELQETSIADFIKEVKETLKSAEHVRFYQDQKCRLRR